MKINVKILGIVILVVALIVVGIILMGKDKKEAEQKSGVSTLTKEQPITGKLTDDMWVELTAQLAYRTDKVAKVDPYKVAEEHDKLFKKFGILSEEYNRYSLEIQQDPERDAELNSRVGMRLIELQAGK